MKDKYINLKDFSLAWRWLDKKHNLLPKEVLEMIKPLSTNSSVRLFKETRKFFVGDNEINPKLYQVEFELDNASGFEKVKTWLNQIIPEDDIYINWSPEETVFTNTNLFISYWDDFCYPSSDDVLIFPEDQSWILTYSHWEFFAFALRKV